METLPPMTPEIEARVRYIFDHILNGEPSEPSCPRCGRYPPCPVGLGPMCDDGYGD